MSARRTPSIEPDEALEKLATLYLKQACGRAGAPFYARAVPGYAYLPEFGCVVPAPEYCAPLWRHNAALAT